MTAAAMLPGLSQGCMSAAAMQYEQAERGSQPGARGHQSLPGGHGHQQ